MSRYIPVRSGLASLGLALAISGCGERKAASELIEPRPEPIVVYASYKDPSYLPSFFADFTNETGIRVTVRNESPDIIVSNVIEDRGSPPADLILTPTVFGVWRASDNGALLPLNNDELKEAVPEPLRDPDGYWTAVSYRTAQIVFRSGDPLASSVSRYEDLAAPAIKGKVCLSSSTLPENRSLIAGLIDRYGVRDAELIVRGWVANLALPPRASEVDLLRAIEVGTCAVGIVSSSTPGLIEQEDSEPGFVVVDPQAAHVIIEAAGINRHAREPEAARQLLAWILSPEIQEKHAAATGAFAVAAEVAGHSGSKAEPASGSNAASVAWNAEDAGKLAERAHYR
jgi:iron(III) transport system substrate-binding protein